MRENQLTEKALSSGRAIKEFVRKISISTQTAWYSLLLITLLWFSVLMIRITLRYIPYSSTAAFLQIKQTEVETLGWYLPVFYLHVYSAVFTLPAGFTQFRKSLLKNRPRLHRQLGWLYGGTVLFLAAPTGLLMGFVANGGPVAEAFFITLSIFWWAATALAISTARKKDFKAHRAWMIRSYALALSAITLRLWKLILVKAFAPPPMDVYVIVSGLGWVPNWLVAEWLIFRHNRKARQARF